MYYVYILQSKKDSRFYTGYTHDLRKRFSERENGIAQSTKGRGPFILIYYEACIDKNDAKARELFLKSGMGKRYIRNRCKRFLSLTG